VIKFVRVILGLEANAFTSGLQRAKAAFGSFTGGIASGIGSAVQFLGNLGNAVRLIEVAFSALTSVAKGLFDTFIGGLAAEQRLTAQLGVLMGGAQQAQEFLGNVADENLRLGFTTDDMIPAINKGATALKAMSGAVDPAKLDKFTQWLRQIKAARPDLGYEEISQALTKAMSGDVESFKRLIGVGLEDITTLSEKSQETLANLQQAGDQQLGQVTKIGKDAKPSLEDMMALMDDVTENIGMGKEALAEYGDTWDAQIARLKEIWDTFADEVGKPVLAVLIEELGKLADFLIEHKADIVELAKTLGKMTAEGIKNAFEALKEVDWDKVAKSGVAFAKAFSEVDWTAVAKTIGDIANFMGLGGEEQRQKDLAANEAGPLGQVFKGLNSAAEGLGLSNPKVSEASPQTIDVKVSVDDDGKLNAVVKNQAAKAANQAVGEFVHATTAKSGSGVQKQ